MPRDKDFKKHVRARMASTGERYTRARAELRSVSGGAPGGVPGWHLAGDRPEAYEIGLEAGGGGSRTAYLRTTGDPGEGFGTLMQTVLADEYRDRRVRFTAELRGEEIERWAGLWMRVDGVGQELLGFDNMQDRPLRGSFDWSRSDVVLEVPVEAQAIAFGVVMGGKGGVRLREVRLEAVGRDVPVTRSRPPIARQPQNLDFSDES